MPAKAPGWGAAGTKRFLLARFLPYCEDMFRARSSADALLEILVLCEQTLTALRPIGDGAETSPSMDNFSQSRRGKNASTTRPFVLIQGGLSSRSRAAGT